MTNNKKIAEIQKKVNMFHMGVAHDDMVFLLSELQAMQAKRDELISDMWDIFSEIQQCYCQGCEDRRKIEEIERITQRWVNV